MLIQRSPDIRPSEITPKHLYLNRRRFLAALPVAGAALAAGKALADAKLEDYQERLPSRRDRSGEWIDLCREQRWPER
jgi:methionine sulfoxide reductase catalytic subunit